MRAADVLILGANFFRRNEHELTAVLTVVLTVGFAVLADRSLAHWASRRALSPEIDTRLRFLRRFVTVGIAVLGVLFALSQFGGLHQFAAGVLASSAIIAAIVGFAARQTLANLIAGVMLTITQPLRIGDQVSIEDHAGVVEDVRLNYTVLRGADGRRLFIPNERLAAGVLRNDTIIDATAVAEVSLWLPLSTDLGRALELLAVEQPEWTVTVAEVTVEGTRIVARGRSSAGDRATTESAMREQGLGALRRGGLLGA